MGEHPRVLAARARKAIAIADVFVAAGLGSVAAADASPTERIAIAARLDQGVPSDATWSAVVAVLAAWERTTTDVLAGLA